MDKSKLKEAKRHSSAYKPFSYYVSDIPDLFPCVPLHWHEEFELNCIREGRGEFICGEQKFIAEAGDIVIMQPNLLHAIYQSGNDRIMYDTLVFASSMLGLYDSDRETDECIRPLVHGSVDLLPLISPVHSSYEQLKTASDSIIAAAKGDSPLVDMLIKSELLRFFWLLEESGDMCLRKDEEAGKNAYMRPVIEYINQHYTEELTIACLAEKTHLSKSYFMGGFKHFTGVGAVEYINQLRLKKARELLEETGMTVSELAFACGFRNLSNFNRQFRMACGCSPREYRKKRHSVVKTV